MEDIPWALVAPIQALMQAVPSRGELQHLIRTLKPGQELEPEKLIVWLAEHGYNRLDQVEVPGDYAVRGGIIDVYLPGKFETADESGLMQIGLPVRIDFFGDQVESIRRFNIDTLGSEGKLNDVEFVDLKGKLDIGRTTSALKYLPEETIVIFWAPLEIAEQSKHYLDRLPEVKGIYPLNAVLRNIELTWPYFHDGSAQTLEEAIRVMARVQVFEPWHVTLRDNVRGLVPRSRPARTRRRRTISGSSWRTGRSRMLRLRPTAWRSRPSGSGWRRARRSVSSASRKSRRRSARACS